jgi:hypothetical protein
MDEQPSEGVGMSKGYAEGPAAEEAERQELTEAPRRDDSPERLAVYGSTEERPERHFLGWRDEVDPDELFASGAAWGITIVRGRATAR